MTRKKDRTGDTRSVSGPSPGRGGKTSKASRVGETTLGKTKTSLPKSSPKKPRATSPILHATPTKRGELDAVPWNCQACGHEHKVTRRSVLIFAKCTRCQCVRGDVVHSLRLAGVGPLLKARPFQNEISFRCFSDPLDVTTPTITTNPHSAPGGKLYKRFHKAYTKSEKKEVKVMFHGTSARAAVSICATGMDPAMRLSGGDWFTVDSTYALSRAISREEYAVANANASTVDVTCDQFLGNPKPSIDSKSRKRDTNAKRVLTPSAPSPDSTLQELTSASDAKNTHSAVLPPTMTVRVVAVAVLLDDSTAVGDHVVVKNHHHALPLFVVDFTRDKGEMKKA